MVTRKSGNRQRTLTTRRLKTNIRTQSLNAQFTISNVDKAPALLFRPSSSCCRFVWDSGELFERLFMHGEEGVVGGS
ncbi:hypothetical protein HPP92_015977 [Vanilla planifolia]|uniref:Uncharacterized protein n=1 Tax=Vanilla planifolia TaxID=51239 RepID=A0A835UTR9_VANPL|nr:hypothetical protein HPP92_016557 [Vanilla planifolia]KAG0471431.1 hypothetical protein HPP92_015977 [Vanilla planifolia]